jgi:AAA15 family ATPase/GTPase
MILQKIEYQEFGGTSKVWTLKNLTLEKINLLVGKNAIGKTRTIRAISSIGNLLAGIRSFYPYSAYCSIELTDYIDTYKYLLEVNDSIVLREELFINSELYVERKENGLGKLVALKENKMIDFQVPEKQFSVLLKQDAIQHSYLQKLLDWAIGLRNYAFGSSLGRETWLPLGVNIDQQVNPRNQRHVSGLFLKGKQEFGDEFVQNIIESMNNIGYTLTKIDIDSKAMSSTNFEQQVQLIYVVEGDRDAFLFQNEMSQGMFRALSLLIQIAYNTLKRLPTTILIDDIGEGLDFDRSTRLIELLIQLAEESNIQLIMSTNDRYVMNKVPLKYWQIIQRSGGECNVFNYQNNKAKFEEFKCMGLNNFDFLATDFINTTWEKA